MSRLTTEVTYGVISQTVELRVQQGRPSAATFAVHRDFAGDDDTAEFSGTATITDPSTTVDASSGPAQADPQKLSLAATTGIVTTRKYLVSEGSKQEWVQPIEVVSADYIRCRHPLKNNYTTAATLVSTNITAAIDDTWAAAEENLSEHLDPNPDYRVRWSVTVGGVVYITYSFFDLVRSPITYEIDIDDLDARAPGLLDSLPTEYATEQGRPLVATAWRAARAKLAAHAIDVDAFRSDEILDELVMLKSLHIAATGGWKPLGYDSVAQYALDTGTAFETFFQQHVSVTQKPRLGAGTGGGADRVTAEPFWSK